MIALPRPSVLFALWIVSVVSLVLSIWPSQATGVSSGQIMLSVYVCMLYCAKVHSVFSGVNPAALQLFEFINTGVALLYPYFESPKGVDLKGRIIDLTKSTHYFQVFTWSFVILNLFLFTTKLLPCIFGKNPLKSWNCNNYRDWYDSIGCSKMLPCHEYSGLTQFLNVGDQVGYLSETRESVGAQLLHDYKLVTVNYGEVDGLPLNSHFMMEEHTNQSVLSCFFPGSVEKKYIINAHTTEQVKEYISFLYFNNRSCIVEDTENEILHCTPFSEVIKEISKGKFFNVKELSEPKEIGEEIKLGLDETVKFLILKGMSVFNSRRDMVNILKHNIKFFGKLEINAVYNALALKVPLHRGSSVGNSQFKRYCSDLYSEFKQIPGFKLNCIQKSKTGLCLNYRGDPDPEITLSNGSSYCSQVKDVRNIELLDLQRCHKKSEPETALIQGNCQPFEIGEKKMEEVKLVFKGYIKNVRDPYKPPPAAPKLNIIAELPPRPEEPSDLMGREKSRHYRRVKEWEKICKTITENERVNKGWLEEYDKKMKEHNAKYTGEEHQKKVELFNFHNDKPQRYRDIVSLITELSGGVAGGAEKCQESGPLDAEELSAKSILGRYNLIHYKKMKTRKNKTVNNPSSNKFIPKRVNYSFSLKEMAEKLSEYLNNPAIKSKNTKINGKSMSDCYPGTLRCIFHKAKQDFVSSFCRESYGISDLLLKRAKKGAMDESKVNIKKEKEKEKGKEEKRAERTKGLRPNMNLGGVDTVLQYLKEHDGFMKYLRVIVEENGAVGYYTEVGMPMFLKNPIEIAIWKAVFQNIIKN